MFKNILVILVIVLLSESSYSVEDFDVTNGIDSRRCSNKNCEQI